jgi:predicted DCC family thiol-disulfide oxidoreductase YuxK
MTTKVFYNHSCNICKTEIIHYKKITKDEFDFIDITDNYEATVSTNLDKATLLRRMHVIENGTLHSGAKAFLIVWSKIPRYRILSKIFALPVIFTIFHLIYEAIAYCLFLKNKNQLTNKE